MLWVTEGFLHNFDTTTTTNFSCNFNAYYLGQAFMTWKQAESHYFGGGLLCLLGVGISMGSALLTTKAAQWLANETLSRNGLG